MLLRKKTAACITALLALMLLIGALIPELAEAGTKKYQFPTKVKISEKYRGEKKWSRYTRTYKFNKYGQMTYMKDPATRTKQKLSKYYKYRYNEDGSIKEIRYKMGDVSSELDCNEKGYPVELSGKTDYGEFFYVDFKTDEDGYITETKLKVTGDKKKYVRKFKYTKNKNGTLKKMVYTNADGDKRTYKFNKKGLPLYKNKLKYKYDKKGRVTKLKFYKNCIATFKYPKGKGVVDQKAYVLQLANLAYFRARENEWQDMMPPGNTAETTGMEDWYYFN